MKIIPVKILVALLSCLTLVSCSNLENASITHEHYLQEIEKKEFPLGVIAAKDDLQKGILAYEDCACEEEEGWQILWCFRKLLADHGVQYRVISPSPVPGVRGRYTGYNSVTGSLIEAKLGANWMKRFDKKARSFHRNHWREVEKLYQSDRKDGKW